jgi:hypothetical protein
MNTPKPLVVLPLSASTISDDFPACDSAMTYEIQPRRIDSVKAWNLARCVRGGVLQADVRVRGSSDELRLAIWGTAHQLLPRCYKSSSSRLGCIP